MSDFYIASPTAYFYFLKLKYSLKKLQLLNIVFKSFIVLLLFLFKQSLSVEFS